MTCNLDLEGLCNFQQAREGGIYYYLIVFKSFPSGASGKEPAGQCWRHKRHGSILGLGRSPGGEQGNPLQYSCLENPMD